VTIVGAGERCQGGSRALGHFFKRGPLPRGFEKGTREFEFRGSERGRERRKEPVSCLQAPLDEAHRGPVRKRNLREKETGSFRLLAGGGPMRSGRVSLQHDQVEKKKVKADVALSRGRRLAGA